MHDVLQADLFPKSRPSLDALSVFSDAPAEDRGAVHTRPEVAEFVLDAVGWTELEPLESCRLLEPSAGEGDFLMPAVERLISRVQPDDLRIGSCIRAVEVNLKALQICHERIEALLLHHGWSPDAVQPLLDAWLLHDDFLSVPLESVFSHIVGTPPTSAWKTFRRICSRPTVPAGALYLIAPTCMLPSLKPLKKRPPARPDSDPADQSGMPTDSLIEANENSRFMRAMNDAGIPAGHTASQA